MLVVHMPPCTRLRAKSGSLRGLLHLVLQSCLPPTHFPKHPFSEVQNGINLAIFQIFWGLVPGFVFWVLGIVFWVLGFVFWVSGLLFWVLGFVFWVLGFVFGVSGFVFWVLGLLFWVLGLLFWVLGLLFLEFCRPSARRPPGAQQQYSPGPVLGLTNHFVFNIGPGGCTRG